MRGHARYLTRLTRAILSILLISIIAALGFVVVVITSRAETEENYRHLSEYGIERAFYTSKIVIEVIRLTHIREAGSAEGREEARAALNRIKSHYSLYDNQLSEHSQPDRLDYFPDYYEEIYTENQRAFEESYFTLVGLIEAELRKPVPDIYQLMHSYYDETLDPFLLSARRYNDSLLQLSGMMFAHVHQTALKDNMRLQTSLLFALVVLIGILVLLLLFRRAYLDYTSSLAHSLEKAKAADEVKTQFLANISHELRTPLNGIMGMGDLLRSTQLDEEQLELLNFLQTSAQEMTDTVRQLLDFNLFSKKTAELSLRPIDLGSFVDHLTTLADRRAGSFGGCFRTDIPSRLPRIMGDGNRLFQILWSLIDNACKYAPEGEIELKVSMQGEYLLFAVRDNGPGVPVEIEGEIFDPFFRGEDAYTKSHRGMGMGLSIAAILTQQLKGTIEYHRREEGGALFTVGIPVSTLPHMDDSLTHSIDLSQPLSRENLSPILIAEDEVINRMYLKTKLRDLGFNTLEAGNGEEAIRILHEHEISCILMDIGMPKMNGLEATRIIRQGEVSPSIPIIAVTAYNSEEDREKFAEVGINEVVSKPVDFSSLEAMIVKLARR